MRLHQLRLENLRAFPRLELDLQPGWNVFVGPNGAGKTTLLEAAYLLSHARSFRPGPKDSLVRHGAPGFSIYGRLQPAGPETAPIGVGIARASGRLEARVDGAEIAIAELLRHAAVVCFDPGSHELIAGPAELRRRFLDWGVFHVEPDFLGTWRTFQRALRQRNALLRSGGQGAELDAWDNEFAQSGTTLASMRARYLENLRPELAAELSRLLPELGAVQISEDRGWATQATLAEHLAATRDDDLRRGFSGSGPQRADWTIAFERAPRREHLSRGQEKLCALAAVLAQARVFSEQHGEWPIVCIDDLASELDTPHQEGLVRSLHGVDAQILVTGTHRPQALVEAGLAAAWFHVDPGQVAALL
ncbi:MAG: DNA replication/repair protein RecF [Rhodanobacteraceae bacterium]